MPKPFKIKAVFLPMPFIFLIESGFIKASNNSWSLRSVKVPLGLLTEEHILAMEGLKEHPSEIVTLVMSKTLL